MEKSSTPIGLKEIARDLGLSVMTVSNIINDHGRRKLHGIETQNMVLEYARKHNYRPNQVGRLLQSRRTASIGFVAKNYSWSDGLIEHDNVYPFLVGMNHYLSEHEFHTALVEVAEIERGIPRNLRARSYDGLVVHWALADRIREVIQELNLPVVWWDVGTFEPMNCLDRDEKEVGRTLTRRLIELGHQKIGFNLGRGTWAELEEGRPVGHYSFKDRFEGYRAELQRHEWSEIAIRGHEIDELADQVRETGITAVVTPHAGAIHAFRMAATRLKRQVPRDLSVMCCDFEKRWRTYLRKSERCDGVAYDRYWAGQRAAEMVLGLIENGGAGIPSIRFTGDLSLGNTTAAAPEQFVDTRSSIRNKKNR